MNRSQQATSGHVVDRVQDTASWVAMARALESERSDALFHDSLARRLAGPQGEVMVRNLSKRRASSIVLLEANQSGVWLASSARAQRPRRFLEET